MTLEVVATQETSGAGLVMHIAPDVPSTSPAAGPALVSIRSFAPEPSSIPAARRLVSRFAGTLSREALFAAKVAVSELVTNAIRHSGTSRIDVRVSLTRRALRVEVADLGRARFADSAATIDGVNGRGLQLVRALADRCGVERRLKTVAWFEIDHAAPPGNG